MRKTKEKAGAVRSPTSEWLVELDTAMDEAAKQTERARSRADSRPRQSDDYPSPDITNNVLPREPYHDDPYLSRDRAATSTLESHRHIGTGSYSGSDHSSTEGDPENELSRGLYDFDIAREERTHDALDVRNMSPEERERRQDELLERMQRVLNGEVEQGFAR